MIAAQHIYFLKCRTERVGSDEPLVCFAHAQVVRRGGGPQPLWAENVQVPVRLWENGGWRLRPRRLPDRGFAGYAYRMPAPDWFELEKRDSDRAGRETNPGPGPSKLLYTTPLGELCRQDEVRRALAQDRLAAALAPWLSIPDLLLNEDLLGEDWRNERPERAAAAEAAAEPAKEEGGLKPLAARLRRRLRLAALRRIDAAAVGREIFQPCPAYFGEPHLRHELPAEGRAPLTLKAGIVRLAHYWAQSKTDRLSRDWSDCPTLVRAVEELLLPWPSAAASAAGFEAAAEAWAETAPLRAFEERSVLPLFPRATVYPEGYVPPGFRVRIRPETVRRMGGSYLTLAAAGLSPYIAEPFAAYCRKREGLLAEWEKDPAGLAEEKWG